MAVSKRDGLGVAEGDNIAAAIGDNVVNVTEWVEEIAARLQKDGFLLLEAVIERGAFSFF